MSPPTILVHLSMSRAGSGFLYELLLGHPDIYFPAPDNINQSCLLPISHLNFTNPLPFLLDQLGGNDYSSQKYIYYGMHNPLSEELNFLSRHFDVKILFSSRNIISSFLRRIKSWQSTNNPPTALFLHGLSINTFLNSLLLDQLHMYNLPLETLHLAPSQSIRRICEFLDIPFYSLNLVEGSSLFSSSRLFGQFSYTRCLTDSNFLILDTSTLLFIYVLSKNYLPYSSLFYKSTYQLSFTCLHYLLLLFKPFALDKLFSDSLKNSHSPLVFFLSFISFRYYFLLALFGCSNKKFYHLSPLIIYSTICSKLGLRCLQSRN